MFTTNGLNLPMFTSNGQNFLALLRLMVNLIETHSSSIHCVVLWDCVTSQATIMTYIEVTRK